MASDVIKWVLIAGAGYLIYNEFFSTPAASTPPAAGSGGSTPPAPPPPYQYAPPTTVQQLQTAAGASVTQLDADQWSYYWTKTLNKPAISDTDFSALFFPNGRPSDSAQNPEMTAAQFVAAIATRGLSGVGLGRSKPLFLPVILNPNGAALQSRYRRRAS